MLDVTQIGLKIVKLREDNQMSQDDLANKLFISRQAISKWERGLAIPGIDLIIELSKLFNKSIDEILCLDDLVEIDKLNIFNGHSREFIISSILNQKLKVDISEVIYQFGPLERIRIIKAINSGILPYDKSKLAKYLSVSEQKLLYRGEKQ
ncbi:MAG: helix-turn-helix domain-containing protein [Bacillales bacterium]|jgi:transcriptional regulator with XRE-family HTH domain|nr:helix-turn-helix domain-containing protein [Bacillales bacterium]